jgi:integrase
MWPLLVSVRSGGIPCVAPGKNRPLRSPGGLLPFGLARQAPRLAAPPRRWLADCTSSDSQSVLGHGDCRAVALADWLSRVEPRLRPSTHRRYQELAGHLKRHLGTVPLAKLTPAQIGRCYAALQLQPPPAGKGTPMGGGKQPRALSATTVHHCHAVLRKALGDAVREGLLARNVATLVVGAPMPDDFEPTIWTLEQTRTFLAVVRGDRLGAFYLHAACTGMRNGELRALRWRDIDLDTAHLQVRQAFQRGRLHQPQVAGARRRKPAVGAWSCPTWR